MVNFFLPKLSWRTSITRVRVVGKMIVPSPLQRPIPPRSSHFRIALMFTLTVEKSPVFSIDPMDNQATYTMKHMYTGQRDHHKNVVIQYDADGKSCDQCMGNKKKDVLELFIRGKIPI